MSKRFKEYKQLDLITTAQEELSFWKENAIFEKSITSREGNPQFVFYEGPPSANGMPGIHHVMARAIKDIFCRYQTQKGKQVHRKAGWDTHGLPVELGVEKELGITKEDIGTKISIEEYNDACRKAVMKYTDVWNDLTEKIGYWVDLENPYITYKPKYMETVWWLLKEIYNKNLIYKGYTIQPYSPAAGTGLSSHELNMPGTYKDVTDTTIVAQFKIKSKIKNNHKIWANILENSNNNFDVSAEGCGGTHHWNDIIQSNAYFLAWTTTPWTLPSNTALTVGAKIEYVLVKTFNQYTFESIFVILAKNLVGKQFGKLYFETSNIEEFKNYSKENKQIPFQIISEYKGKDLIGIEYEQLLPWALPYENPENAFKVIDGDFVTTEDGTGIVHTAPTFGADDAKVAKEHNIPAMLVLDENKNPVPLVDLQGKFIDSLPEGFGGKYVKNEYYSEGKAPEKSIDVEIAILLKTENKAFKVEKYVHTYPHCWRTDKPVLYYPLDSWFIKTTAVKDRMVELNKTINWKPKATGEGRFGNWLENVNDWNLSRSRYWGIPLPIWRTEDGKEEILIGSVAELYAEIEKSIKANLMTENPFKDFIVNDFSDENYDKIDLHKNIVDKVILVSESGKPMKRESDLIDVWFDSGAMPYAQVHYPFSNSEFRMKNEEFKNSKSNQVNAVLSFGGKGAFTADFIAEGVDQTRGWFYTLHAISTLVFDDVAYKNVVSNGLVLDKDGQKMSKRLGNAVDPFETLQKFGPDATRWYMINNANPWENLKFDINGIDEVRKKFFGTLHNTYSFFALYANVDDFHYSENEIPLDERPEIDQWILSELHTLIKEVDECFADYEPTKATRVLSTFVNDNLSNWYVRLCRRRFWKGDYTNDKISAYQTLYTCLIEISKLIAPIAPFYADKLYKDLNNSTQKEKYDSVHLAEFPQFVETYINQKLQTQTHIAQEITSLALSLRKKDNIKVRQPLQKIMIPILSKEMEESILKVKELIQQEINVKEIHLLDANEANHLIEKTIKPNFKTLGPKLGSDIKKVSLRIQSFSHEDILHLESAGSIEIEGHLIDIEDVEISTKDIPGWSVASNGKLTVALDININDTLKNEGIARELVNRIQNIRKEQGFDLTDSISLLVEKHSYITNAVEENKNYICTETLATNLQLEDSLENGIEIDIDDTKITIIINKN